MAHERLGLFDTPPNRREIRLSLAIVGLLFAALFLVFPLRDTQLGEIRAFVPLIDAFMLFSELIIATLALRSGHRLSIQSLDRFGLGLRLCRLDSRSACADVSRCFCHKRLAWRRDQHNSVARDLSAVDVSNCSHFSMPCSSQRIPYHRLNSKRPAARVIEGLVGAIVLAALGTLLTTVGHDLLPPIFLNSRDTVHTNLVIVNLVTILLTIAAMALLFRQDKSVLDLWLLVALVRLDLPVATEF